MNAPSLPLLAWCGLAATLAATLAAALSGSRSISPFAAGYTATGRALVMTAIAGVGIYPLIYGLLFEALQRADLLAGAAIGSAHALLAFAAARRHVPARAAMRPAAAHLVYAITIAFLYVTP